MKIVDNDTISNPFVVPEYATYPEITAMLGILYAHNNYEEWVYNNFILLWAYEWIWDSTYWCDFKFGHSLIQYEMCPMIKKKKIDKNDLKDKANVIKFFEKNLSGNYIYVELDMISVAERWKKKEHRYHLSHPVLIYGFSRRERVFYCADFFEGKYKKFTLTYAQLLTGYFGGDNYLYIWKYRDIRIKREHNIVFSQIKDFIKGKDTTKNNFLNLNVYYNVLYGFEALDRIRLNIKVSFELDKDIDLRSVHLIKVHNQIMKERLLYWKNHNIGCICGIEKGELIVDEIISNINILEMVCIKFKIKPDCRYHKIISEKFEQVINQMKELYEVLLDIVDDNMDSVHRDELWNYWDKLKSYDDANSDVERLDYHDNNLQRIIKIWREISSKQYNEEIIFKYIKECSQEKIVSDFYENIFPLEIQEDGFLCRGQIIEVETGSIDEKKYYYDNNQIIAIEYMDKVYKKCWFLYFYDKNKVFRFKFRQSSDAVIFESIKLEITENNCKTLYSYSKGKRKVDVYYLNGDKVISSERYCCYDDNISIYKWIKNRWSQRREYIYAIDGELLQIFMYDYENTRKMIYSNLNRQLGEEQIMNEFYNILCNKLLVCDKVLNINLDTEAHKIVLTDNNSSVVYKFLKEYDLNGKELERLGLLFGIEIYKVLENCKPKCSICYCVDSKEFKVLDGSFIKHSL